MPEQETVDSDVFDSMQVWLELDDRGLACLIYRYQNSLDYLMSRLRPALQKANFEFAELRLPVNKSVSETISWLKNSIRSHPNTPLFFSGWDVAFPSGPSRIDAIRQINFQRETIALHPLQQIWLFTTQFELDFVSLAPDFYSWFETKWRLLENRQIELYVGDSGQARETANVVAVNANYTSRQLDAIERVAILKERILEAKKRKLPLSTQLDTFNSAMEVLEDVSLLHQSEHLLGDVFPSTQDLLEQRSEEVALSLYYLGLFAVAISDYPHAISRINEAKERFQVLENVLGEANCIRSLGDIAFYRFDYEPARVRYEEALNMFRQVGQILGEAMCFLSFANLALKHSSSERAMEQFNRAIELYRNLGNVEGEGECLRGLGDALVQQEDFTLAKSMYVEALSCFDQLQNCLYIGGIHQRLARIANSEEEKKLHIDAAREAWKLIGFDHLLAELDAEFGEE